MNNEVLSIVWMKTKLSVLVENCQCLVYSRHCSFFYVCACERQSKEAETRDSGGGFYYVAIRGTESRIWRVTFRMIQIAKHWEDRAED